MIAFYSTLGYPKEEKKEDAPATGERRNETEAESFAVGPFNRDNSRIVLTSKKGWYVASVKDGVRNQVLTLDDKNETNNPRISAVGWTPAGDALLALDQRIAAGLGQDGAAGTRCVQVLWCLVA